MIFFLKKKRKNLFYKIKRKKIFSAALNAKIKISVKIKFNDYL